MSKPNTPKPPYPAQFREQMIELVRAGRKPGELAKEFGCHATSIMNWVRQADEASGVAPAQANASSANERQELIELRRKLRSAPLLQPQHRFVRAYHRNRNEERFCRRCRRHPLLEA